MQNKAKFGPAGNSDSFTARGYKSFRDIPKYIREMNLDVFEYQCGRGVRISEQNARELGELAAQQQVGLSLHAPYYISLSGLEEQKRLNSARYLLESAQALRPMGGQRIVLHSGSAGKQSREQALALAKQTLRYCLDRLDEAGFADLTFCPETMGKVGQLGSLEEVMELCSIDERLIPCIDFGHLNARTQGGAANKEQMAAILDTMENRLGRARAQQFHAHFSKIAYTTGGEKCHLTFSDTQYGPEPEPLLELIVERGLYPTIICESAGTQAEDALYMKKVYEQLLNRS